MRLRLLELSWVLTVLLFVVLPPSRALASSPDDFGGGPVEPPVSLITEAEIAEIQTEVARTVEKLTVAGRLSMASEEPVRFQWPLRAGPGLEDYGYHGVSGFVDHDPATGSLLDYMCGRRTYDLTSGYNHGGTDFFTYPFPWNKMDRLEVEIVAAAPGTLVFKRDGQYDRQCSMTGAYSNAVVIQHADGTRSYYYHMKNGSVTEAPVGATVAAGEYLGVVGSSGSSTGPHLHFEVRNGSNEVIDPYEGPCNARPSMWAEQPSYHDSAVIAVHTGDGPPYRPACPEPEIENVRKSFGVDESVTFITTYRDQMAAQTSTYRIIRPDGTLYTTWDHASSAEHYRVSYWYWTKALDQDGSPPEGQWRFEVDFEGEIYKNYFYVGEFTAITVTHPNGGEGWVPGTVLPIVWDDALASDVSIDLYADGVFDRHIVTATRSDGVYFWGVPADLPMRTDYTVRVSDVANREIFDSSDDLFTIAPNPVADFEHAPLMGPSPLSVTFSDTSTSLVDSWLWDFGDGVTGRVQHPTHVYTTPGVYTVTLSVTGPSGGDVLTRTHAVMATVPPLTAAFTATPLRGKPPVTVTFTDRSIGPPADRWLWSFGDGVTATMQHPSHMYTELGTYTVTLTIGATDEETSTVKTRYIEVTTRPWHIYVPVTIR